MPIVLKSRSLNLLEPTRSSQACTGISVCVPSRKISKLRRIYNCEEREREREREKTNKMQQSDVYYQYCLNMFRASLCPSFNMIFRGPCIMIYSYNKSQRVELFLKLILINNSIRFGQITVHHQEFQHSIHSRRYLSC